MKTPIRQPCGRPRRNDAISSGVSIKPGGKLPLFDRDGREVPRKTIASCIAHGWAEPWTRNPIKPEWLVCRLTSEGYRVLGHAAPPSDVG
jgi:hypothetical protein